MTRDETHPRMRYEDERYVRSYTRDTTDWQMMDWQARVVWNELIRKVDRAGLLELGRHGLKGLATHLRLPVEVVEVGLPGLIDDKWVEQNNGCIIIPDHIQAQEALQTDAQRKREQRERARARARRQEILGEQEPPLTALVPATQASTQVTNRDFESRPVTAVTIRDMDTPVAIGVTHRDQLVLPAASMSQDVTFGHKTGKNVTDCHAESQPVTDGHSDPIRADPILAHAQSDPRARIHTMGAGPAPMGSLMPPGFDSNRLLKYWGKKTQVSVPGHLHLVAQALAEWAEAQEPPANPNDLIERAVDAFVERAENFSPQMRASFNLSAENFCHERHWPSIQQALAGRPPKVNGHVARPREWEATPSVASKPPPDVARALALLSRPDPVDDEEEEAE